MFWVIVKGCVSCASIVLSMQIMLTEISASLRLFLQKMSSTFFFIFKMLGKYLVISWTQGIQRLLKPPAELFYSRPPPQCWELVVSIVQTSSRWSNGKLVQFLHYNKRPLSNHS